MLWCSVHANVEHLDRIWYYYYCYYHFRVFLFHSYTTRLTQTISFRCLAGVQYYLRLLDLVCTIKMTRCSKWRMDWPLHINGSCRLVYFFHFILVSVLKYSQATVLGAKWMRSSSRLLLMLLLLFWHFNGINLFFLNKVFNETTVAQTASVAFERNFRDYEVLSLSFFLSSLLLFGL